MATWIQMLANSYFVYWHCLISEDFLMSLTFSDPSHPGVLVGNDTAHRYGQCCAGLERT